MAIPYLTEADFHDPEGLFFIQQSWPTVLEDSAYERDLHKHYATDHGAHYFEALARHQETQCLMPADPRLAAILSDLPF